MEHLIPQYWFDGLSQPMLLVIGAFATAMLIKGADWIVESASAIALRAGLPKIVVGATIVSLGTTSPECAVSVMAAWAGEPGLALGNAVGSIVADTGLIFGLGCLLVALPADRFVLNRQGWIQFAAGLLLACLCYGAYARQGDHAVLGRPIGVLMLVLLAGYLYVSVKWSRTHPHGEPFQTPDTIAEMPVVKAAIVPETTHQEARRSAIYLIGVMLAGLVFVVFSSRVLVCCVTTLAQRWGVPQVVIAATLVALGTSLPELVVGLTSILKGHKEILVGNIIGADILNVLFVVGASACAAELPIVEDGQRIFLYLHLPAVLLVLALFRLFTFSAIKRGHFSRWNGVPLLVLYVGYVVLQFVATRG